MHSISGSVLWYLQRELQGKYFRNIVQRIKNDVSGPVFVFQRERRDTENENKRLLVQTYRIVSPSAGKSPHDTQFCRFPTSHTPALFPIHCWKRVSRARGFCKAAGGGIVLCITTCALNLSWSLGKRRARKFWFCSWFVLQTFFFSWV